MENRVFGVQCVGSSGALRLAAEFLRRFHDPFNHNNNNNNNNNRDDNNNNNNNVDDEEGGDVGLPPVDVLVSKPTRDTHRHAFQAAGWGGGGGGGGGGGARGSVKSYRYWDEKKKELNLEGMLEDLEMAPEGECIDGLSVCLLVRPTVRTSVRLHR